MLISRVLDPELWLIDFKMCHKEWCISLQEKRKHPSGSSIPPKSCPLRYIEKFIPTSPGLPATQLRAVRKDIESFRNKSWWRPARSSEYRRTYSKDKILSWEQVQTKEVSPSYLILGKREGFGQHLGRGGMVQNARGLRATKCEWCSCREVCGSLRGFPSLSGKWVYYSTMEF